MGGAESRGDHALCDGIQERNEVVLPYLGNRLQSGHWCSAPASACTRPLRFVLIAAPACPGSRQPRSRRHGKIATLATLTGQRSDDEYDGFEYGGLPVNCSIFIR